MIFKSTKSYYNLPCSHQQWQDADTSGVYGTGQCSKTHGYSREVHLEFSATDVDDYGWVVGFGSLKPVKNWLEWLFDHTALWEAGDPRLQDILRINQELQIPIYNLRVLPSGVSMEQTTLFLSIYLNAYILDTTNDRCWISRLEVRENDKNSGVIEFTNADAHQLRRYFNSISDTPDNYFPRKEVYDYIAPKDLIKRIKNS
jgi:6-pyruvoyltetrahydropterin/6-carboxytetrahydropterin synthase